MGIILFLILAIYFASEIKFREKKENIVYEKKALHLLFKKTGGKINETKNN